MDGTQINSTLTVKVYDILKKVVDDDIENYIVTVHDPNKKGEGYSGQMFFVSLQDKRSGKHLDFVVKQAFSEDNIRKHHPIRDIFLNEIYFYTKMWPKLLKFQERVSPEYRFLQVPKCFAAISENNFERLVLENLKYQKFQMHDKRKPLEKGKFELIFKMYGRFHAISFAYRVLNPGEFSELTEGVLDLWADFTTRESFSETVKLSLQTCLDNLRSGEDDAIIKKFKHYIDDGVDIFKKSLVGGKYTAILHGDCWSNNMMFKYDKDGNLTDLRFLDFQLYTLGSPVCDLSYCLYSGGTKETFDDLDHLLEVYHDSLAETLRAYGCDANELYPLEALKSDWKHHCQLGVITGLMIWRGKMVYDEEVVDLTDLSNTDKVDTQKIFDSKYDQATFAERVRDILLHLYQNDYIV